MTAEEAIGTDWLPPGTDAHELALEILDTLFDEAIVGGYWALRDRIDEITAQCDHPSDAHDMDDRDWARWKPIGDCEGLEYRNCPDCGTTKTRGSVE